MHGRILSEQEQRQREIRKAVKDCSSPDKWNSELLKEHLKGTLNNVTDEEIEYAKALRTVPSIVL